VQLELEKTPTYLETCRNKGTVSDFEDGTVFTVRSVWLVSTENAQDSSVHLKESGLFFLLNSTIE
jgi:hypothetical protein